MTTKILVIDDDPIVLESCRVVLESEGYGLVLVSNAQDAFDHAKETSFDLALVDVKMPGLDGMSFLRWVHQRKHPFPVILMTGYTTQETLDAAAREGAALVLPKPFTPDELVEAIRQVT